MKIGEKLTLQEINQLYDAFEKRKKFQLKRHKEMKAKAKIYAKKGDYKKCFRM